MSKKELPIPMRWWFAGLTATLGGLAGLIGSIYAVEIADIPPFGYLKTIPYVPLALFIIFLFLFGLLFGYGFRAQVKSQDDSANTLNEQIYKLEDTIRTLPPDNFLAEFEDTFRTAFSLTADALACTDNDCIKDKLSDAIYTCLASILELAIAYDQPEDGKIYTVSIMLMRPLPSGDVERTKLRSELQMFETTTDLSTLEGYLETHADFSISSNDYPTSVQEQSQEQIKLPVPKSEYRLDNGGSTILPGAPAAWCSPTELQYIPNVETMLKSLQSSALRPSVQAAASDYFKNHPLGSCVKSFISLSFGIPSTETEAIQTNKTFGVVNLHSTSEGLLDTRRAQLYGPLTQPTRALLSMLWQRWIDAGHK